MKTWGAVWGWLFALALSVPAEGAPHWFRGERLDYEVHYGFVTAGYATLWTHADADGSHLLFTALAQNNGFFESVYPVKDTIVSRVQCKGLIPEYFRKVNHEGGYHARSQILFDWGHRKARLSDTVFTDERKIKRSFDTVVTIPGEFHNILSAFYKVRLSYLEPGKDGHILAVSGKKKYAMRVICHRREMVTVAAGTFPCLVVEPVLEGDGIFQAKGSLTIWLTDDARRLPVLMKSKISVGSIRAELKGWSQGPMK